MNYLNTLESFCLHLLPTNNERDEDKISCVNSNSSYLHRHALNCAYMVTIYNIVRE